MLESLSKHGVVSSNKSFKQLTTLKVGGNIKTYFEPKDMYSLILAVEIIKSHNVPYKIIGNGSNMLCSDDDYDGVVIKLINLNHFELNDDELYIEAGVPIITAANYAINNGYSGLEFATGIPAMMGGIVFMNASAYKESISDVIDSVLVYKKGSLVWMSKESLRFSYRKSIFQDNPDWIIVALKLRLTERPIPELKEISISRNRRRFDSQPYEFPNCGSVFRNIGDIQVWKVIDELDLRGKQIGNAIISPKHSNFICNLGNCTADSVNELINLIRKESLEKRNLDLHLEVERFNW